MHVHYRPAMTEADKREIVAKARGVNPKIAGKPRRTKKAGVRAGLTFERIRKMLQIASGTDFHVAFMLRGVADTNW